MRFLVFPQAVVIVIYCGGGRYQPKPSLHHARRTVAIKALRLSFVRPTRVSPTSVINFTKSVTAVAISGC